MRFLFLVLVVHPRLVSSHHLTSSNTNALTPNQTLASDGGCGQGAKGCCGGGGADGKCCMDKPGPGENDESVRTALFDPSGFAAYDPSQDLIFPPELMIEGRDKAVRSFFVRGPRCDWYRLVAAAAARSVFVPCPQPPPPPSPTPDPGPSRYRSCWS